MHEGGPGAGLMLRPEGRLDADTCAELRHQLATAFSSGVLSVAVDLSRVTIVDLTGVGVLSGAARHLRRQGGVLVVTKASAAIETTLRINGLGDLLEVPPSPVLRMVAGSGEQTERSSTRALSLVRPDGLKRPG